MNRKNLIILILFFLIMIGAGIAYRFLYTEPEPEIMDNLEVVFPGAEISALFDDGDFLWVGTADGIYLLGRDTGEIRRKLDSDIQMIYAAMIVQTNDGLIWAGHDAGLSAFDKAGTEMLRFRKPEIPGGRVNTILAADEGLWIGTQEGAAFLEKDDSGWKVSEILTQKNGLTEEVVQVIARVEEEIWFGAYLAQDKGGISIRSEGGWQYLSTEEGIPHRYINAILPLSDQKVLIGSGQLIYGGLSLAEKSGEGWKITENWNQEDGIPGMKVRCLFLDSTGRLWITTEADGILILDSPDRLDERPLKGILAKQENGLADDEVKCIVECDNCFWLGGKYGLTRFGKGE